ncbi:sigma-70 family RNA polymerase sigma factor [Guptibacillus hwajinpoensis]|uniref:sigma-70 family RNA polymerase sigma factor n=1 Tax=Guptibacillus hwajinpoensis TaxID=208199 RepID=UPI0024B38ADA|nr:sigma-70 family RNA polymerase sigma factor [Pseudalkalibacillus hwajinpoensis]
MKNGCRLTNEMYDDLKGNLLFKSFIQEEKHWTSFMEAYVYGDREAVNKLNSLFQKYYTEIRFIAYVTKLIRYTAINFDRKRRLGHLRFPLTLDQPVGMSRHAWIYFIESTETCGETNSFAESFQQKSLYLAYSRLTPKQMEVLELFYRFEASDTEIAKMAGISQQAASRRRKRALEKLREAGKEGDK